MKIIFFGTPDYVVPILESLHKTFKSKTGESPIAAVVTQAPKPTGRKQELSYSPVDTWAHKQSLRSKDRKKKIHIYFDMEKLIQDKVRADMGIIAAYGALLPKEATDYFPHGILVIHPSLLPQFRWGSPVQAAIVTGTNPTGVTIIKMDEKFDHGPIVSQFKEEVLDTDATDTLRARLFEKSAEVLTTLIPVYLAGKIIPREQDHSKASFARMITKDDAYIPAEYLRVALKGGKVKDKWQIPFIKNYSLPTKLAKLRLLPNAYSLNNFIRAMQPWPGAWTEIKVTSDKQQVTRRLIILKAHLEPISVVSRETNKVKLELDTVQLEGKNIVTWKQFLEGYPEAKFT